MNRMLILVVALLVFASAAEARFIMFDATFDNRPVGSSLDRRGARYGEPIEASGDNHSEVVVQDGPGDRSVQIWDTTTSTADVLTFALLDGRELVDGKLNVALVLQPDVLDVYKVAVEGPDPNARWFFNLTLDAAGILYWADGDDLPLTAFGAYAAGVPLLVELAFDLEVGTYDFTLDGALILTNEPFGITAYGAALVVVGNQFDGNATGSVRVDDLAVDYVPGTADNLLTATFNNQPVGQPIGTGGAELGQPVSYNNCLATVDNSGFPTRSLLIEDDSDYYTGMVRFEFLNSVEAPADVSVSFWLAFETLDSYVVYIREQGGSAEQFLNLNFVSNGTIWFDDEASDGTHYHSETYAAQQPLHVEIAFYADRDVYSVWVDGERVVHRRAHGVAGRGVGALLFGTANDADLDGRMRVDGIRVDALAGSLTDVEDDDTPAPLARSLHAAPNPFNPATALSFSLPLAGQVQLDIIDLRGRRVRQLVSERLAAGEHAVTWQGSDDAGRPVASGVYQALLQVDGRLQQRLPMTLLK